MIHNWHLLSKDLDRIWIFSARWKCSSVCRPGHNCATALSGSSISLPYFHNSLGAEESWASTCWKYFKKLQKSGDVFQCPETKQGSVGFGFFYPNANEDQPVRILRVFVDLQWVFIRVFVFMYIRIHACHFLGSIICSDFTTCRYLLHSLDVTRPATPLQPHPLQHWLFGSIPP